VNAWKVGMGNKQQTQVELLSGCCGTCPAVERVVGSHVGRQLELSCLHKWKKEPSPSVCRYLLKAGRGMNVLQELSHQNHSVQLQNTTEGRRGVCVGCGVGGGCVGRWCVKSVWPQCRICVCVGKVCVSQKIKDHVLHGVGNIAAASVRQV